MNDKSDRLLKRFEFQRIKHAGKRLSGRFIFVEFAKNSLNHNRLGITVTRKFGNAVTRNRFKRIVREAFQQAKEALPVGYDIVVRPREAAQKASSQEILSDLLNLRLNFLNG